MYKSMLLIVFAVVSSWLQAGELPVNTRLGGDFQLESTRNGVQGLTDFKGRVVLLNFGYTNCPDICPMVLNRMALVMNELDGERDKVQPVFITFDSERDTRARLREYLGFFGEDFIGFTGTAAQLSAVAKKYGVIYVPQQSDSAAGTLYAHSDYVYLLDQQGRVRALFGKDDSTKNMVAGIESLLED
jgi:protein SCO1/2